MTHFAAFTNVIVPKEALDTVDIATIEAQVDKMYEPYYEQTEDPQYLVTEEDEKYGDYQYNPNAKWDWYVIGGRFEGSFLNKETITTYMDGQLVKAKDLHDYVSDTLTKVEDTAREFLTEYKELADQFGPRPELPNYDDVTSQKITIDEYRENMDQVRQTEFYQKLVELVKSTNDKVEQKYGIDPDYLFMFSSTVSDILFNVTLEDEEKDFKECVAILEWFSPVSYVDKEKWCERGSVGWFGVVGDDQREDTKWVYEYADLIAKAAEKSTDDEESCIVIVDVHT